MAGKVSDPQHREEQITTLSAKASKLQTALGMAGIIITYFILAKFETGYIVLGHAIDGTIEEEVYAVHSKWSG